MIINIYVLHCLHYQLSHIEEIPQTTSKTMKNEFHFCSASSDIVWFMKGSTSSTSGRGGNIHTGDSLLELVEHTFDTIKFFKGVFLEFPDSASDSAASSWSIIVIRFFSSFPRSPEIQTFISLYSNITLILL